MRHLKARLMSSDCFAPKAQRKLKVGNVYAVMFGADGDPSTVRAVNTSGSWGGLGRVWKLQMDDIELQQPVPVAPPIHRPRAVLEPFEADDDGMHEVDDDEIPFF